VSTGHLGDVTLSHAGWQHADATMSAESPIVHEVFRSGVAHWPHAADFHCAGQAGTIFC
jgi:hypothetical protein